MPSVATLEDRSINRIVFLNFAVCKVVLKKLKIKFITVVEFLSSQS
jgi:hypothetical protein